MLRNDAIEIWKSGVAAVHGRTLVEASLWVESNHLHIGQQVYNFDNFDRILIVGGGKFSHYMAEGIEKSLGEDCLLYTSPSPRDRTRSRMPSSA